MQATNHEAANMTYPNFEHPVPTMTVEAATTYARRVHGFIEADADASGLPGEEALDYAYDRFERVHGIGRWTVEHLRKGKAKTCDVGVFARLRGAYLDLCQRQVAKLQHQIEVEKATGDDALEDLEAEARALAERIAAKKRALTLDARRRHHDTDNDLDV